MSFYGVSVACAGFWEDVRRHKKQHPGKIDKQCAILHTVYEWKTLHQSVFIYKFMLLSINEAVLAGSPCRIKQSNKHTK